MIRALAILLVVQLGILAYLTLPREQTSVAPGSLVEAADRSRIDRVEIADAEGAIVTLQRDGIAWRLPSGLPVDRQKLDTLLDALLEQDPGLAVATSQSAAARFKVSTGEPERRITLTGTNAEYVVFLGTSPAFRKTHARRDGDAAIYAIDLNTFDAPTTDAEWLDQTLLARTNVTALNLYGRSLTLSGDDWSSDDGRPVAMSAMETVVQALANLRVNGIAAPQDPALAEATESLRIDITDDQAKAELVVLRSQMSTDKPEQFFLQDSRYAVAFDTSAYDAERLTEAVASLFVEEEQPAEMPLESDAPLP